MAQDQNNRHFDFVICGAGLYGLYLANLLCSSHYKVLIITSTSQLEGSNLWTYESAHGYTWSKYQNMGGKSLYWGGNLSLPSLRDKKQIPYELTENNIHETLISLDVTNTRRLELTNSFISRVQTQKNGLHFKNPKLVICESHYIHKIHFDKNKASAVEAYNFTEHKRDFFHAENIILACSPFENATILLNSKQPFFPSSLAQDFNDHLVCSYLVLVKKKTMSRTSNYKFEDNILQEITGPYNLSELSESELSQMNLTLASEDEVEFFMFHGFTQTDTEHNRTLQLKSKNHLGYKRPYIDWSFSENDLRNAHLLEKNMETELSKLFKEENIVNIFQNRSPLELQGIPHETGGCLFGKVTNKNHLLIGSQNLYIADASVLPCALDGYPTLTTLLCVRHLSDYLLSLH